jgi:hypothetical protein
VVDLPGGVQTSTIWTSSLSIASRQSVVHSSKPNAAAARSTAAASRLPITRSRGVTGSCRIRGAGA